MSRETRSRQGFPRPIIGALVSVVICTLGPALCAAAVDDPATIAAALSNQAFAILNSLNAASEAGTTSPLLGPVAGFAGDAQTLSQALSKGDSPGAGRAMSALKSDAAALATAIKRHPGSMKAADWRSLEQQFAALEKRMPAVLATGGSSTSSESAPPVASPASDVGGAGPVAAPDAGEAGGAGIAAGSESGGASEGPRIEITSRSVKNNISHVKGYFEGTYLKSAGIYEGDQRVRPIKIDKVLGRQKVKFDLTLNGADVGTNLRVYDHAGRKAVASIYGGSTTALAGGSEESGVEVYRGSGATSGGNTEEIPSHRSGSLGSGRLSPMSNVQIDILSINVIDPLTHVYQIRGQIDGHGVRHAGIYVDGRLVKRLPVSSGAGVSSFNTTFILNGGSATIRAFGVGNRYVETSIQIPSGAAPPMIAVPNPYYAPYGASPYAMRPSYGSGPSFDIHIGPGGVTPYTSPYGTSPYGAYPYGVNPYASPYGATPNGAYGAPPAAHPWGNAPAPPSASGW